MGNNLGIDRHNKKTACYGCRNLDRACGQCKNMDRYDDYGLYNNDYNIDRKSFPFDNWREGTKFAIKNFARSWVARPLNAPKNVDWVRVGSSEDMSWGEVAEQVEALYCYDVVDPN